MDITSQEYRTVFPVSSPILVKPPLSPAEQEALKQHGCIVELYPTVAIRLSHLLRGNMITFPPGTQMAEKPFTDPAHMSYDLLFPDDYRAELVWEGTYSMRNIIPKEVLHG